VLSHTWLYVSAASSKFDVPYTALLCRMYRMLSKVGVAERHLCSGHEPGSNPYSITPTSLLSCLMKSSYLSCTAENRWSTGCKISWWTSSKTTTKITIGWVPSSVYWLDYETYGPGIKSRQRQVFFLSQKLRPAPGPTQPPVQRTPRGKAAEAWSWHLNLTLRSWMCRAVPLLSLYAFMAGEGRALPSCLFIVSSRRCRT
jgi:hypothetical protein